MLAARLEKLEQSLSAAQPTSRPETVPAPHPLSHLATSKSAPRLLTDLHSQQHFMRPVSVPSPPPLTCRSSASSNALRQPPPQRSPLTSPTQRSPTTRNQDGRLSFRPLHPLAAAAPAACSEDVAIASPASPSPRLAVALQPKPRSDQSGSPHLGWSGGARLRNVRGWGVARSELAAARDDQRAERRAVAEATFRRAKSAANLAWSEERFADCAAELTAAIELCPSAPLFSYRAKAIARLSRNTSAPIGLTATARAPGTQGGDEGTGASATDATDPAPRAAARMDGPASPGSTSIDGNAASSDAPRAPPLSQPSSTSYQRVSAAALADAGHAAALAHRSGEVHRMHGRWLLRSGQWAASGVALGQADALGVSTRHELPTLLTEIRRSRSYSGLIRPPSRKAFSMELARSPWRANIFSPERRFADEDGDAIRTPDAPSLRWRERRAGVIVLGWGTGEQPCGGGGGVGDKESEVTIFSYEIQISRHEVRAPRHLLAHLASDSPPPARTAS